MRRTIAVHTGLVGHIGHRDNPHDSQATCCNHPLMHPNSPDGLSVKFHCHLQDRSLWRPIAHKPHI
jgi:hypothetical protein